MDDLINLIRAIVRPIITIFLTIEWGMMMWAVFINGVGEVDGFFTALVVGLIGWYFCDRTLLKGKSLGDLMKGSQQ